MQDRLEVWLRISRIGGTSFHMTYELVRCPGEETVARAETVLPAPKDKANNTLPAIQALVAGDEEGLAEGEVLFPGHAGQQAEQFIHRLLHDALPR